MFILGDYAYGRYVCISYIYAQKVINISEKNFRNMVLSDNAVVPDFILKGCKISSHLVTLYMFA